MRGTRAAVGMLALVAALGGAGCLVEVREVRDPTAAFDEGYAAAARVQGRSGPAHHLNLLAYEPEEHELVRLRMPMWVACRAAREGGLDLDDRHRETGRRVRERLRGDDWRDLPLGVLLEVRERDGERVLVWLD